MPDVSSPAALKPAAKKRSKVPVASCEGCYFRNHSLCALDRDEPCATYRPNSPDGLRPPQQLRFQFRTDSRHTSSWAFPTADEQAALHG